LLQFIKCILAFKRQTQTLLSYSLLSRWREELPTKTTQSSGDILHISMKYFICFWFSRTEKDLTACLLDLHSEFWQTKMRQIMHQYSLHTICMVFMNGLYTVNLMWPHCFYTSTMNDTHGSTACLFYVAMFHTLLFDLLYNVWRIVVELSSRWICINTWFDVALMI
jgi:hypothetical protein